MSPPRQRLEWKEVLEYTFLAEFDLLRFSREDIRVKQWAQAANREAMSRYFKIKGTREEINRLDVEIRRLVTSIDDEQYDMPIHVQCIQRDHPALAAEIERRWVLHHAVNVVHMARLQNLLKLPGFSGMLVPGKRLGRVPPDVDSDQEAPSELCHNSGEDEEPELVGEDDEGELSEEDELVQVAHQFERWNANLS